MIVFWSIAIIMMVAVLGLVAPALLGRRRVVEPDRNEQNVYIARERLRELKADLQNDVITETQFDHSRNEVELALLTDISTDAAQSSNKQAVSGRWTFVLLLLLVPTLSSTLYMYLGHSAALNGNGASGKKQLPEDHPGVTKAGKLPTVQESLARLVHRLEQQPDDAQGWFTLGRTYLTMGRYPEAAEALGKVHTLVGDQPAVLLSYADALAMANDGRVSGKPLELIHKLLQVKPDDPTALWLAGIGYEEQGEYEVALRHWKQLEPLLVDDAESLTEVRQLIASAEEKLGRKGGVTEAAPAVIAAGRLTVKVSLDPALQAKAWPTDTVFVFARAMQGPSMPLAVVRKQVSDLPLEVTLDDAMAMMPGMKLSNFSEVLVGARISKSGNAMPQSGDLTGEIGSIPVARTSPVQVVINSQKP